MQYKWNWARNATKMRPSVLHCSSDSIYIALRAQFHLYCIADPIPFILHCAPKSIYIALQGKYVYAMCLTHMCQTHVTHILPLQCNINGIGPAMQYKWNWARNAI